jgi:Leucine-rich repeat (LRR) protein
MTRLLNLTELDLTANEIESIPESVGGLASLQQLSLADNWLTGLPRALCCGQLAANLRLLNLAGNRIKLLPNYICQLKVIYIIEALEFCKIPPPPKKKPSNYSNFQSFFFNLFSKRNT